MKLIRLVVLALAFAFMFGTGALGVGVANADAANQAKAQSIAKQAKKKCRTKRGQAKRHCIRTVQRRLVMKVKRQQLRAKRRQAKRRLQRQRQRQHELNNPRVTIRTTEYGIPRIVADNWRGLGYGYGYALAKENICPMAQIYTTVRGERSRYFGPNGSWQLTGNGITYTNLQSDFAHKRWIVDKTIPKIFKMAPPNGPKPGVKATIAGYVLGYNEYLKKTGVANLPDATCRGEEWVKPITRLDAYLRFLELGTMAGEGAAVDGIADASPPNSFASAGSTQSAPELTDEQMAERFKALDDNRPDIGSNAVGLGSDATTTGKGMLFGNPHFPWFGSERFFESQLTIPGKINASGASLMGAPVILIGHTRNLAWSHTVSTARRFNFFRVDLAAGDPTSYMVDGNKKKMKETEVTVAVKQPDDSIVNETRTLYSTKYGPIATSIQKQPLFAWDNNNAYAIFDPNSTGLRFINHFFDTNQSQSVAELEQVLKEDLGVPWVNTIAADSQGNAMYADISVVPNLTDARVAECNVPGIGTVAWQQSKVAVLDGATSSCDMQQAPGAPAKGILGPDQLPVQIRKDFTSNMNDSYWLSNPAAPLTGFPSIIGDEGTARSLRTRNGLNQIESRLNGTDGQPGNKFDLDRVTEFITNNHNYGGELFIPPLVDYCQSPGNSIINGVDVSDACAALDSWDQSNRIDSEGSYLAARVIGRIQSAGPYTNPFNLSDPIHTPSGLNTSKAAVPKALSDAVTELTGHGIPVDAKWGNHQYVIKNGQKIPIPGGSGGQGMFNVISSGFNSSTGDYDSINHGSSFIINASMTGDKCPDVKTILTYSQAETNVESPHYSDQTELFSNSEWVTDRFCRDQQEQSPDLEVTELNGGSKLDRNGW